MLTDGGIQRAIQQGEMSIEPFADECLQPASYDLRVGRAAFVSSGQEMLDVAQKGLVVIEPGEFAVVETYERVTCGPKVAAQLGLRSEYARHGLLMLSGPQVDPGFGGILVVRLINLAPKRVTLPYQAQFLTLQLFALATDVERPYGGPRQSQKGISPRDIQELSQTEGMTLGQVVRTLGTLAQDVNGLNVSVARLEGSVSRLSWLLPLLVAFGIAVTAIIVALR